MFILHTHFNLSLNPYFVLPFPIKLRNDWTVVSPGMNQNFILARRQFIKSQHCISWPTFVRSSQHKKNKNRKQEKFDAQFTDNVSDLSILWQPHRKWAHSKSFRKVKSCTLNTVTCRVHILWKAVYHIVRKIFRHKDFWTIQFSAINSHKTFIPLSSSRFIWSTFRCQMCNPPSSCVFNWKKPDKSFVWSLFKVINN